MVACLQCNLNFKKIKRIIHICKKAREKAGKLFQSVYTEAVSLANEFDIEKEWSQSCGLQINWNSIPFKAIVVITGTTHCFRDYIYVALILLLRDLSILCVGDMDYL